MRYFIYKITNTVNGKIYIGKHMTEDINDGYLGSGKLIKLAIKKYGKDNFKKEILFELSSEDEMNNKEKEIVNESFIKRDDNYNLTIGGSGGWAHCNGENHNNKNNHRRIGILKYLDKGINISTLWFSKLSEEEKLAIAMKISTSLKRTIKERGPFWLGKKHSEETKKKMSEISIRNGNQKGEKNSQFGKMWIHNNETFENKKIYKTEQIPIGWSKGRIYLEALNKRNERKIILEKKKIEKENNRRIKIEQLRILHQEYIVNGYEGVVQKFDYKFSKQNLVKQFTKYLEEFIPQNGKKRCKSSDSIIG